MLAVGSFPWKDGTNVSLSGVFGGKKEPAPAAAPVAMATATAMPVMGGGVAVAFGGGGAVVATSVPLWVEARIVAAAASGAAAAATTGAAAGVEPEPEPAQTWMYRSLGAGVVRSGVSKGSDEVGSKHTQPPFSAAVACDPNFCGGSGGTLGYVWVYLRLVGPISELGSWLG